MQIKKCELGFEREALQKPFGFKGGSLSELWQTVCRITLDSRVWGMGTGVQSVLWSDTVTFHTHTQAGGNALMLAVTEYALQQLAGIDFSSPPEMIHSIADSVHSYARRITGRECLPRTFTLNALVCVDFALWQIWARQNGQDSFDAITRNFCPALREKQSSLGAVPLISYTTGEEEIKALLENGAFVLKIKIGSDPDGNNDPDAMLQWDAARLRKIHGMAKQYATPYTDCGHPVYYLDANGRYDTFGRLLRFLDQADSCGALDRILLLEEPFPEQNLQDIRSLPVHVAGDESAHCAADAVRLIEQYGYGAIALKPIAKTLSETLAIFSEAKKRGVPCFCADLTVPPLLLDWNMNVAARLAPLPGLKIGIIESNGPQNYSRWEQLLKMHPVPDAEWLRPEQGKFMLSPQFYSRCAPFSPAPCYERLL